MEWLYYLLEANLYLLLFYGFYRLFLAKTTFYSSNRYFLIAAILFSFLIPLIQISFLKPKVMITGDLTNVNFENLSSSNGIEPLIQTFYIIACVFLAIKLMLSLSKIAYLWRIGKKHRSKGYTIVELDKKPSAFSFFNFLFIHPSLLNNETIIKHELVHINEKHSLDLLLLECIKVICWFNPIIYFIKNDFKLLHEFIADQTTTEEQNNKHQYAMFLIESSLYNFSIPFTNQFFNQRILKQRINMLNKEKTAKWVRLNFVLAIPLILGMLCLSTLAFSKDYGYFDILSNGKSLQDTTKKMRKPLPPPPPKQTRRLLPPPPPKVDKVKFPPPIVKPDGKNLKTPPPVEPPPPGYKTKRDQVKFPPPIIKKDEKRNEVPPPPKADQVKFPPPIVKPDKSKNKMVEGDPIKKSDMKEVVIIGDPTKSQNKLNDEIKEVIIKAEKKQGNNNF